MNILLISTSYPTDRRDWRGRFIADMVAALHREEGLRLHVWLPPGDVPSGVQLATSRKDALMLNELRRRGGIAHLLRRPGLRGAMAAARLTAALAGVYRRHAQSDGVVHVNWLQNALPLWNTSLPLVVSVLGTDLKWLRLPGMVPALRRVFKRRPVLIAPNAGWMEPVLRRAFGDLAAVRPIPFGVEAGWFRIRRGPDLERAPLKWIGVLRLTRDKIGPLFDWGASVFTGNNEFHLLGPNQENLAIPSWVHYHGATFPDDLIRNWFPQAAGLVTLSRHAEGRPQVILEAMAAGLPVIASDVPAHRDVIAHRRTGWLVRGAHDLAEGIHCLGNPRINHETGEAGRRWVAEHVGTWKDCARRYANAYRDVLHATCGP